MTATMVTIQAGSYPVREVLNGAYIQLPGGSNVDYNIYTVGRPKRRFRAHESRMFRVQTTSTILHITTNLVQACLQCVRTIYALSTLKTIG